MKLPTQSFFPLFVVGFAPAALAQVEMTFSVDRGSMTALTPSCGVGPLIRGSDILIPSTPSGLAEPYHSSKPCIAIPAGAGAGSLGLPVNPLLELDALSYGSDQMIGPNIRPGSVWFSVDRSSRGSFQPPAYQPSLRIEWFLDDAAGSMFSDTGLPALPFSVPFGLGKQIEVVDGNGYPSAWGYTSPSLGLREPVGDELDAFDVGPIGAMVYFSVDTSFVDPCTNVAGSGTAALTGFAPGAILRSNLSGNAPQVWATPAQLGLDGFGLGTDDLDALAIANNGGPGYDAVDVPLGWVGGGGDMVLFSVRKGSAVIGMPDSLYGQAIEPGDVLMPRLPGGVSPFPAIAIPAEALGLTTHRALTSFPCGTADVADDLDALDTLQQALRDCNGNNIEDALDIVLGLVDDTNRNGIADGCDPFPPVATYCTAGTTTNGCTANMSSTGLASASGVTTLQLHANNLEGQKSALFFYGISGSNNVPWGPNSSSFLCVKTPVQRMTATQSGGNAGACDGAISLDFSNFVLGSPGALGAPFAAGDDVWTQAWFRDPPAPKTTNLSNALRFTVIP